VVCLLTIGPLAVTTVWRSFMTTGPIKDRRYFFPNNTWVGWIDHHWLRDSLNRIDHNWFNDFILGPGTVACFYLAFTGLYALAGLVGRLGSARHASNHKRRMKIILYVILGRALLSGWAEEVQLIPSPFIFDVKDVVIEGAGVVLAYWMIQVLSYPRFSRVAPFICVESKSAQKKQGPKFVVDIAAILTGGAYTWIVDPFGVNPLTRTQLWMLPLELSVVFLAVRWALQDALLEVFPKRNSTTILTIAPLPQRSMRVGSGPFTCPSMGSMCSMTKTG
jgi:hypothetical protein